MKQEYFLTGATGFLGMAFLKIASINPETTFYCLVRPPPGEQTAQDRLKRLLIKAEIEYDTERFIAVAGDIEKPGLGLAEATRDFLSARVKTIVHAAALVGFLKPYDELCRVNVEGTRHVISFAKECQKKNPAFDRLGVVGTAYVAGKRTGRVTETELCDTFGFKNAYEKSKYGAECLARETMRDLPITIARPSIIIGATTSGDHQSVAFDLGQTMQPSLRLLLSGQYRVSPLNPRCPIDFIPVDEAARALAVLFHAETTVGHVFHITTGDRYPYTLENYAAILNKEYQDLIPAVRFIDPGAYDRHVRPRMMGENPRMAAMVEMFDAAYKPYLMQNPIFDTAKATPALASAGIVLGDPAIAFRAVLRRAAGLPAISDS